MNDDYLLLVEDDPDNASLTLLALKRLHVPYRVVVARDGLEALDHLMTPDSQQHRGLPPRLVLMDLKLPKLTGIEVLEKMRADDRTRFIPVVIFSSSEQPTEIEQSAINGANSYVRKPVNFDEYCEVLRSIVTYWFDVNLPNAK